MLTRRTAQALAGSLAGGSRPDVPEPAACTLDRVAAGRPARRLGKGITIMTDRDLYATYDQAGGREQPSEAGGKAPASKGDGLDEALGPDGARWAIRAADGTSHVVCWYATGELYAGQPGEGMWQAGNCPDLESARRQVLAIRSRLNGGEHS